MLHCRTHSEVPQNPVAVTQFQWPKSMLSFKNVGTSHCLKHSVNNNQSDTFSPPLSIKSRQPSHANSLLMRASQCNASFKGGKRCLSQWQSYGLVPWQSRATQIRRYNMNKIRSQRGRTSEKERKGKAQHACFSDNLYSRNKLSESIYWESASFWVLFFFLRSN